MDARGESTQRARRRLLDQGVEILHEDNHVLVVAKPPGVLSQSGPRTGVVLTELLDAYRRESEDKPGRAFVGTVHRLDRNVSGVLVVAKTSKAARRLSEAFRLHRDVRKTYLAWVAGRLREEDGTLVDRLVRIGQKTRRAAPGEAEGREARLAYVVEGRGPRATRLRIDLSTGRTHQIRAQLAAAGHPLVGDAKYGGPRAPRPALHAWRLAFPHPVGGEVLEVEAAPPADLLRLDVHLGVVPPLRPARSAS